jgi:LacI family transcriptional regulator
MPTERRVAVALNIDEPYPHHQQVLTGVRRYAREHPGWNCIIDEHPGHGRSERNRGLPAYDGVLARASPALQRRLEQLKIPMVNVWYQHARPGVAGVYPEPHEIGRLAAEHLLERGFKKLGFIGDRGSRQSKLIGQAFSKLATERGGTCWIDSCQNGFFKDRGYWLALAKHLGKLLDQLEPPMGIFVIESGVARFLTTICDERGWRVAQEMALVCWDNVHAIVELPPQITCIDSNYERVGYEAAKLLDRLMAAEPVPQQPLLLPPKGVIPRDSTDYFAVEDELVAAALRYISSHLRQKLSVEDIANAIAAAPRTLQRQFQAALGRPVGDEVRRLRLELAKRLLGDQSLQVSQVARMSGFNSAANLSHVFQRELGVAPNTYRKQVIGERAEGKM